MIATGNKLYPYARGIVLLSSLSPCPVLSCLTTRWFSFPRFIPGSNAAIGLPLPRTPGSLIVNPRRLGWWAVRRSPVVSKMQCDKGKSRCSDVFNPFASSFSAIPRDCLICLSKHTIYPAANCLQPALFICCCFIFIFFLLLFVPLFEVGTTCLVPRCAYSPARNQRRADGRHMAALRFVASTARPVTLSLSLSKSEISTLSVGARQRGHILLLEKFLD